MTDLIEIRNDALREMYSEAEPPLDFDDVLENPDDYGDEWYKQHYLPSERVKEIFEKHADKHDLTQREHASLSISTITSLSPTSQPLNTS